MRLKDLILLIPAKSDTERDSVCAEWAVSGGAILKLDKFWQPPNLPKNSVRLYGNDTFCLVLAQQLGLELITPPDDLIMNIPPEFLKRKIEIVKLDYSNNLTYPIFIKPLTPKQFKATIYQSHDDLIRETKGLKSSEKIITSEIVNLIAEARCFILDYQIQSSSIYEGVADIDEVNAFVQGVLKKIQLPKTCVLDFGLTTDRGWVFIEANASWGAGLNGCSPADVVNCIEAATNASTY